MALGGVLDNVPWSGLKATTLSLFALHPATT